MRFTQSVFSLAESVHLIVEISATCRLVSCLLTGGPTSLIGFAQYMILKSNIKLCVSSEGVFVIIFSKAMYNKTINRTSFL